MHQDSEIRYKMMNKIAVSFEYVVNYFPFSTQICFVGFLANLIAFDGAFNCFRDVFTEIFHECTSIMMNLNDSQNEINSSSGHKIKLKFPRKMVEKLYLKKHFLSHCGKVKQFETKLKKNQSKIQNFLVFIGLFSF